MLKNLLEKQIPIDYEKEIIRLKEEMNAVILAHYYQTGDIQELADFIGDSLELARKAKESMADVIIFCGVHFMAETAKILNPEKLVLLPDLEAGCSLADSCPAEPFSEFRNRYSDHLVLSYINCSAEIKALSDIIVTSSNAEKIVRQIPVDHPIIFAPDKNLGKYIMKKTGREMVLWDGSCIVHETFNERKIEELLYLNPKAKLIAHPECEDHLLEKAYFIGSTSALLKFVQTDDSPEYIVATEPGIIYQMEKAVPEKKFIPAPGEDESCSCNNCPYMKLNTIEKLYNCMVTRSPEITMPEVIRVKALRPLEKMLEMS
ncbi:quinolinate synthase NadA [Ignavibacteriales bacterium]